MSEIPPSGGGGACAGVIYARQIRVATNDIVIAAF